MSPVISPVLVRLILCSAAVVFCAGNDHDIEPGGVIASNGGEAPLARIEKDETGRIRELEAVIASLERVVGELEARLDRIVHQEAAETVADSESSRRRRLQSSSP